MKPNTTKIKLKADARARLAEAGVPESKLVQTTIDLTKSDTMVELIKSDVEAIATSIVDKLTEAGFLAVLETEQFNGEGYGSAWREQIVADVMETALGTGVQARARKQAMVNSGLVPDLSFFVGKKKEADTAPETENAFAGLAL